uniref:Uncharacterized protein n=1 Tax=Arundo donax TaxID=35708 RepID=A0A0A9A5U5_ARUDO
MQCFTLVITYLVECGFGDVEPNFI